MFRGNDFKDVSQIFCETDRAGQFKYWFIDLIIMPKHIENSQCVHAPPPSPPTPTLTVTEQHCEAHVGCYARKLNLAVVEYISAK